jgi:uncharacterized protein (TIGR03083 family)
MVDFIRTIESESERFLTAVQAADPGALVPTCPDWTAEDLLWHLTEVHAYWAAILRDGAQTEEESQAAEAAKPERPTDPDSSARLFREQTGELLDQLRARDEAEPAWFWLETDRTVGSTRRMQAHEATMHRVDAELTAGLRSAPIDPELAADGIAHGVQVMWGWWATLPGFEFRAHGGTVALTASDLGRTWHLRPGRWVGVGQSGTSYDEPGVVLTDATVSAATVSGSAEDLERWLWGRGPEPRSEGDADSLDALRRAQQAGMQ